MNTNWGLVMPFLTDDEKFANGVEFGMLYMEMQHKPLVIRNYFHRANQEQILLLANRTSYSVEFMKPWDVNWFYLYLRRIDSEFCKANGSGLRHGPDEAA